VAVAENRIYEHATLRIFRKGKGYKTTKNTTFSMVFSYFLPQNHGKYFAVKQGSCPSSLAPIGRAAKRLP